MLQVHWLAQMVSQYIHKNPNDSRMQHSASDPLGFKPNNNLHINQSFKIHIHHVTSQANCQYVVWGTNLQANLHLKYESPYIHALHHPSFWQGEQDVHTWGSINIPSTWQLTNLTMYSTLPSCAMTFGIGKGVELVKLGLLAKFHAQLVTWAP